MPKLKPGNAVGAIVLNADKQVLLQLRDDKPDIFFPNCWGLFGGGVEKNEAPEAALIREMQEELGIDVPSTAIQFFTEFTFDFTCWDYATVYRKFYTIDASSYTITDFTLGEGRELRYFDLDQVKTLQTVPYDAFALWMYSLKTRE